MARSPLLFSGPTGGEGWQDPQGPGPVLANRLAVHASADAVGGKQLSCDPVGVVWLAQSVSGGSSTRWLAVFNVSGSGSSSNSSGVFVSLADMGFPPSSSSSSSHPAAARESEGVYGWSVQWESVWQCEVTPVCVQEVQVTSEASGQGLRIFAPQDDVTFVRLTVLKKTQRNRGGGLAVSPTG